MGKVTGFLEIDRRDRRYAPASDRIRHYREFVLPLQRRGDPEPGGALHELRHPLLSHRLPGQQPDPGLERSRLSRRLGGSRAQPAFHQQLPGIHRPSLPRAVRSVLHAQHPGHAGDHQDDRMRDHRPRLRRRLGEARAASRQNRQEGRDRRFRPRGPRLRAAACARRPRSPCLREARQGGRPAALRHS